MTEYYPKFCTVLDMNWSGEILHGTFDGIHYVLDDGDCYLPETLLHYDAKYLDSDPRMSNAELTGPASRGPG
jgi:hypothetical protein